MQVSAESKSSVTNHWTPAIIVVLAATMVGSSLGIIIADHEASPSRKIQVAGKAVTAFAQTAVQAPKNFPGSTPLNSKTFPTGFSSIEAIHCSTEADSLRVTFDLKDADPIRAAKLSGPDRVFIDLKEKGSSDSIEPQKALDINGDLLRRVRIAHREAGTARVVLDLNRSCDFSWQIPAESPSRLIVELRPQRAVQGHSFFPGR